MVGLLDELFGFYIRTALSTTGKHSPHPSHLRRATFPRVEGLIKTRKNELSLIGESMLHHLFCQVGNLTYKGAFPSSARAYLIMNQDKDCPNQKKSLIIQALIYTSYQTND